jgi:hypothetical protein
VLLETLGRMWVLYSCTQNLECSRPADPLQRIVCMTILARFRGSGAHPPACGHGNQPRQCSVLHVVLRSYSPPMPVMRQLVMAMSGEEMLSRDCF